MVAALDRRVARIDEQGIRVAEVLPSPRAARSWGRDVLPVDPLCADRFLALLRESPELCRPSRDAIPPGAGHNAPSRGSGQHPLGSTAS